MATIQCAITQPRKGAAKLLWETITTTNDVGSGEYLYRYVRNLTVQVLGTAGATLSLIMEGSNDGGTTWFALSDNQGNAIDFSAAGGAEIQERPQMIRPRISSGGDGSTDMDVYVYASS